MGVGRLLGVDEEDDGEGDERRQGRRCDQCKSEPTSAAPFGDGDCTLERAGEVAVASRRRVCVIGHGCSRSYVSL